MLDLVEQWENSGLSQVQFCRNQNIKIHHFRYCVSKKRKEASFSDFRLMAPETVRHSISVVYPNGIRIEIPSDPVLIRELIHLYWNVFARIFAPVLSLRFPLWYAQILWRTERFSSEFHETPSYEWRSICISQPPTYSYQASSLGKRRLCFVLQTLGER